MRYEIRSIEPVGDGDRDVLLELHYWYDGTGLPADREADFIEHHLIVDVPGETYMPVRNNLGQYVRASGDKFEPAWREVNGEWVRWMPEPGDPNFQWIVKRDVPEAVIAGVAERRAREVEQIPLHGLRDLYPDGQKPPRSRRLSNVANRANVRALERRARRVQ